MLILGLLGMYFDASVVFVTSQTLLFILALAILCICLPKDHFSKICRKIRLLFKKNSYGILEIIQVLNLNVDIKEKVPPKTKKINLVES